MVISNALTGIANPFRETVVIDAWHPSGTDVPEIHGRAFAMCREALDWVRSEGRSTSVLLHGEAGSGKTHLLARLRAHWYGNPPHDIDPICQEVVFIAVRLQTGPQRLWRYLRRSMATDLLRTTADGSTQLERILLRRFAEIRPADADLRMWFEWLQQEFANPVELHRILDDLFDRIDQEVQLGRDLCTVLGHLLLKRHRRDAKAWLMGDPLPDATLRAMDLKPSDEDDTAYLEDEARRVVVALCHLAGPTIPVVLCFDQIEALQVDPSDEPALYAFGQMGMALYQQTYNVLLITCVQSAYLDRLKAAVRDAAWARVAVSPSSIYPLRWPEAKRLIQARMDAHPRLAELRAAHDGDSIWPLNEAAVKAAVGERGQPARDILRTCAEMYDAIARLEVPPPLSNDMFLQQTWDERLEHAAPEATVERVDTILEHGIPLLVHASNQPWSAKTDTGLRDIDILLTGPDGRVGISLCNHFDMRGLWRRLQRLPEHIQTKRVEKLVLLRDARLPIKETATKTREYLSELQGHGAAFLRPSAEALAALHALGSLLSDAKAGDLANQGRTVAPQTVQEWLAAHMPSTLQDLLDEIVAYPGMGGEDDRPDLCDRLMELLDGQPVIALGRAAETLEVPIADLEARVRDNPQYFGRLEGPPVVVFRLVPDEVMIAP